MKNCQDCRTQLCNACKMKNCKACQKNQLKVKGEIIKCLHCKAEYRTDGELTKIPSFSMLGFGIYYHDGFYRFQVWDHDTNVVTDRIVRAREVQQKANEGVVLARYAIEFLIQYESPDVDLLALEDNWTPSETIYEDMPEILEDLTTWIAEEFVLHRKETDKTLAYHEIVQLAKEFYKFNKCGDCEQRSCIGSCQN